MSELKDIQDRIISLLKDHQPSLKIVADKADKFEVAGTVEVMQGKKKVDGHYFATVMPKPKDVRFYFFPAYTHKEELGELPENLQKALKGKSCFHIKTMDASFEKNLKTLIKKSIKLYKKDGLLK